MNAVVGPSFSPPSPYKNATGNTTDEAPSDEQLMSMPAPGRVSTLRWSLADTPQERRELMQQDQASSQGDGDRRV